MLIVLISFLDDDCGWWVVGMDGSCTYFYLMPVSLCFRYEYLLRYTQTTMAENKEPKRKFTNTNMSIE